MRPAADRTVTAPASPQMLAGGGTLERFSTSIAMLKVPTGNGLSPSLTSFSVSLSTSTLIPTFGAPCAEVLGDERERHADVAAEAEEAEGVVCRRRVS